jgi:cytochrome c oxidase subunit 2
MSGGEPAGSIGAMAVVLTLGATVILVLVAALALLALRPHRRELSARTWIGGATVLSIAVLVPLYAYTVIETTRLEPGADHDEMVIGITGHQWWWEIRYRNPAGGRDIVTANELHLPVGRRVRLALASADVIHSFWVPALAGKRDLVPGRVTHLALRVDQAGRYRGECAEFCGEQHARMPVHVVAHEGADFDAWLEAQRKDAEEPVNEAQRRGAGELAVQGCIACHVVRGLAHTAGAAARAGAAPGARTAAAAGSAAPAGTPPGRSALRAPDLTHVASRASIAGVLRNDAANRRAWVEHAQTLKPGARMASYGHLDAATLDAIGAYLEHLR